MKILVTGGAGYIGSATAEALLQVGHSVTVYDSLVTGHRAAVPPGATFVQAALEERPALARVLTRGGFDAVMHFAAFIEAGESMKDPGRFYFNNLANSLSLIETTALAGVKRFVLSSTAAVYRSSDEPLTEDAPLGPTNVYGHTKLVVEQALDWYRQIHGLHFAALRYFNACGALPGRGEAHQPESHLIPRVLQVALGKERSRLDLRHGLSHARWNVHPRLCPHRGPGCSPPAGPGCAAKRCWSRVQRGQRAVDSLCGR